MGQPPPKESLKHLAPSAQSLAEGSDAERIASLAEDRWVDYARARQALAKLEWMLNHPKSTRMPGMLIYGESNIGKTMIIQKFLREQGSDGVHSPERQSRSILSVQMPAAPQERRFYGQILVALNTSYRASEPLATVEHRALTLLRQVQPAMIMVDEVHNLLASSAREQRASLNLLKFLSNELHCAIVVSGTRDALAAMQTDDQIGSRFPAFELPRWQESEEFRRFLAGYERHLPLRKPSGIANSRTMVTKILGATAGVTGRISTLLAHATRAAIRQREERITDGILHAALDSIGKRF